MTVVTVGKGQREHGEDLVPVDHYPVGADREAPVGVPVVRDTSVRAVLEDRRGQRVQVGRAAAQVDVRPVRLRADRDDLGTRAFQHLGCHV